MKRINAGKIAMWILAIAPLILVAVVYGRLPQEVPTHWGIEGQVTYGHKSTLWWVAGLSPVLAAGFTLFPKIDPRGRNFEKFRGFYEGFCVFMMLFMLGVVSLVVSESLNPGKISVSFAVCVGCGLLFAFLGNIMPKVKSNFFMGVRTPWALSNDEVWNKTHRLSGRLFFFGGLLIAALAFFLKEKPLFIALMIIVMAATVIPYIMSYVWYKRLPPPQKEEPKEAE